MSVSNNMKYDAGTRGDKNWVLQESTFNRSKLRKIESAFSQGNGYLGQRAALREKYTVDNKGLYLSGLFDRFGEEEVTEIPNLADFTNFSIWLDDEEFRMVQGKSILYSRQLNLKDGVLDRHVYWQSPSGLEVELGFERFVSLEEKHVLAFRTTVRPFNRSVTVRIASGIDGRVTNGGTQHFHEAGKNRSDDRIMEYCSTTGESRVIVAQYMGHRLYLNGNEFKATKVPVMERRYAGMETTVEIPEGQILIIDKICSVFTSRDPEAAENEKLWTTTERGRQAAIGYVEAGYDMLLMQSRKAWKNYWNKNDVIIRGSSDFDQLAVRFALYHLNIMANREDDRVSIGAMGLTGEGHEGHYFWDAEMFLIPFYLLTDPEEARRLLVYRGKSLPGAKLKAYRNGYRGAMYPWESAGLTDGEVTSERGPADPMTGEERPMLTGKKELHISADVSYAVWYYYQVSGDHQFMREWGAEIILATAVFWADRVEWDGDVCHIRDIIGPDEYKERINDNTYTNYMVKHNLGLALKIADFIEQKDPEYLNRLNNRWEILDMLPQIRRAYEGIWLPDFDGKEIIPQFDGYQRLDYLDIKRFQDMGILGAANLKKEYSISDLKNFQVHKQADLVMLLWLFPELISKDRRREVLEANYDFYAKRTIHDAPYSFATHSMMAASLGRTKEAYELFGQCCRVDMGTDAEPTLEGIHAAVMAGIWQCVVQGFCGVRVQEGKLVIDPHLPEAWDEVKFHIHYQGSTLDMRVTGQEIEIVNRSTREIPLCCRGEKLLLRGKEHRVLER